jgi:hypothetical protein
MSLRNGKQQPRMSIPDVAMSKAYEIGKEKPIRIPFLYKCAQCGISLQSAHILPESKIPEGLTGMVVPSVCLKCVEKQRGETPTEG